MYTVHAWDRKGSQGEIVSNNNISYKHREGSEDSGKLPVSVSLGVKFKPYVSKPRKDIMQPQIVPFLSFTAHPRVQPIFSILYVNIGIKKLSVPMMKTPIVTDKYWRAITTLCQSPNPQL